MNRIIRTVLASVGAAAVVSGGALGVAYATAPTPAQSTDQGAASSAELNKTVDDLVAQIDKLEKDLSEPMPTLSTPAPTPEAQPESAGAAPAAPAAAATRAAAKAPAAPAAAPKTTEHDDSDEKSGHSDKDSDD